MNIPAYTWNKTLLNEYQTFNAWIAEQGSNSVTLMINNDIALTANTVIPSNIDIIGFNNESKFTGAYVLTINRMTADPMHQVFGDTTTVRGLRRVRPEWFGAVGNGTHDDTVGIQRALNALTDRSATSNDPSSYGTYGGTYVFEAKRYRITDTIVGLGLKGVEFVSAMGARAQGYVNVGANGWDSRIFWDGIDGKGNPTAAVMFYFGGCLRIKFSGIHFMGAPGSPNTWVSPTPVHGEPAWDDSFSHAYCCVWLDDSHYDIAFESCTFGLAGIGLRVCSQFDFDTNYWDKDNQTYKDGGFVLGLNRYTGITYAPAAAVGGYASDNLHATNCAWGLCTITAVSIESSQALGMLFEKPHFLSCNTGFHLSACQGIVIISPTFLNTTHHGIKVDQRASSSGISVSNSHEESTGGVFFDVWGANGGSAYAFTQSGMNSARLRGGTTGMMLQFAEGYIGVLEVLTSNVSAHIKNSAVGRLMRTNAVVSGLLKLENVTVSHLGSNWAGFKNIDIHESQLGQITELAKIPATFRAIDEDSRGLSPNILLGDLTGYYSVIKLGATPAVGNAIDINNIMFKAGTATDVSTLAVGTVGGRRATFKANGTPAQNAAALALCINTLNPSAPGVADGTWPSSVNYLGIEIDPTITITAVVDGVDHSIELQSGITVQATPQQPNLANVTVTSSQSSELKNRYPVIDLRSVIYGNPLISPAVTVTIDGVVFTASSTQDLGNGLFQVPETLPDDYASSTNLAACINDAGYGPTGVTATANGRSVVLESATDIVVSTNSVTAMIVHTTDTLGMEGTAVWGRGSKYLACTGCYQDAYGRIFATAATGVIYEQTATGVKIRIFDSALVGEDITGATTTATVTTILDTSSGSMVVQGLKVGANAVVGARVIDARLADVANSGDATTNGLINALRDLVIAHGLGAAS